MRGCFKKAAYSRPVAGVLVAADFPNFTFDEFNDPPGRVWADFVHEDDEFVVVVKGEIEIEVDQAKAHCVAGDLVLIPAGARHTLKTSSRGPSKWFYGYGKFGDQND